jgi:hypothetical protein
MAWHSLHGRQHTLVADTLRAQALDHARARARRLTRIGHPGDHC